jgi:hypothetical protein
LPDEADISQPRRFRRVSWRPFVADDGNASQLADTRRALYGAGKSCGPVWIHFNTNMSADPLP